MKCYRVKLQLAKEKTIEYDRTIKAPGDIVAFINNQERYDLSANERTVVIALDTKNHIIAYSEIGVGAIDNCGIDIPSIFRFLFTTNASRFILTHNHPSGDSTPSPLDITTTKELLKASKLMRLTMLDHIVIGDNEYTSILSKMKEGK